jgi:membrane protease YdiL (CAAX protease family)
MVVRWYGQWRRRWQDAHRTTRLMIGVWLGAVLYLALAGYSIFGVLLLTSGAVIGILITLILTDAPPKVGRVVMGAPYNRIVWQIAVLLGIIALTSLSLSSYVPLWTEAINIFRGIGKAYLSPLLIAEPEKTLGDLGAYFFIPLSLLLMLGARWRELGIDRLGHRTGQIALVWCILPSAFILLALWARAITPPSVLRSLLTSACYAFGTEFLFRGALQTRLLRLFSLRWTLVIQALLFALWHAPNLIVQLNGQALIGIAYAIALHGTLGVALGVMALRTRSLWSGMAFSAVIGSFNLLSGG